MLFNLAFANFTWIPALLNSASAGLKHASPNFISTCAIAYTTFAVLTRNHASAGSTFVKFIFTFVTCSQACPIGCFTFAVIIPAFAIDVSTFVKVILHFNVFRFRLSVDSPTLFNRKGHNEGAEVAKESDSCFAGIAPTRRTLRLSSRWDNIEKQNKEV